MLMIHLQREVEANDRWDEKKEEWRAEGETANEKIKWKEKNQQGECRRSSMSKTIHYVCDPFCWMLAFC